MSLHRPFLRRCLGTLAAAGCSTLLVAGSAHAAELREVEGGFWDGSKTTTDLAATTGDVPVRATIVRDPLIPGVFGRLDVAIKVGRPADVPAGCTVTVPTATAEGRAGASQKWKSTASVNCNGIYPFTIDAEDSSQTAPMPQLSSTIRIEAPAPVVNGVNATVAEGSRTVNVKWTAPARTPDFLGFQVQRRLGTGSWTTIASPGPTITGVADDSVPADGGEYSYRVLARRSGAEDNVLTGPEGNIDKVTIPAGDPTTTSTVVDGTTPPTNPDGTPGTVAPGDGTATTTAGGKTAPKVINTRNRGRAGGGTPAPNLGRSTQSGLGVRLNPLAGEEGEEDDGGFGETLPFGDPSIDEADGLAEEGSSSLFYEGGAGRGMAVPVAIGFVCLAWAVHLRFLARASRPEPGQVDYEQDWDPFDPFYDEMA